MPHRSEVSSRDTLNSLAPTEDRRRTGRYVAGGTALAITLLALHHVLLRGASPIAGVCVPAIIMASYIIWVLYSAQRDRRKELRYATAMQLTNVISLPPSSKDVITRKVTKNDFKKHPPPILIDRKDRQCRDNPLFSSHDTDAV